MVAVAATVTCLNGGLFGATGVTYSLAEKGQLPPRFKADVMATTRGLTISAFIAIVMVNFFDLAAEGGWFHANAMMLLPPSAFFIIGFFIWGLRSWKPQQVEKREFEPIQVGESGGD